MQAARQLRGTPAAGLSAADLIQLAGAYAVRSTGGPAIPVLVGRGAAAAADPAGRLPSERAAVGDLKAAFAAAGFSPREMVVLSGSHTLGSKGFGDAATFDRAYFQALLKRPWEDKRNSMAAMIGLPSDHVLPDDPECLQVRTLIGLPSDRVLPDDPECLQVRAGTESFRCRSGARVSPSTADVSRTTPEHCPEV